MSSDEAGVVSGDGPQLMGRDGACRVGGDGVSVGDDDRAPDGAGGRVAGGLDRGAAVDVGASVRGGDSIDDHALTAREKAVLAFERRWWRHPGAKEQAIREELDLSAVRYYQVLRALLDRPAALAHDPVLVGRLRRLRAGRGRVASR